jgi:hypothetical protein
MCGSAARPSRKGASSITAISLRNSSGGNSCSGATYCSPAQLTSTSAAPASASASKSAAARSTSQARPPTRLAIRAAAARSISATTTSAPASASRTAQAAPIPPPPPVITAVRPARSWPAGPDSVAADVIAPSADISGRWISGRGRDRDAKAVRSRAAYGCPTHLPDHVWRRFLLPSHMPGAKALVSWDFRFCLLPVVPAQVSRRESRLRRLGTRRFERRCCGSTTSKGPLTAEQISA